MSLGSNLGDPKRNVERAAEALSKQYPIELSRFYRTSPQAVPGYTAIDQPDFINAVCTFETNDAPTEVFEETRRIEERLGKRPKGKNEPRPIDIDILLFGQIRWSDNELEIPHPRMLERPFVLVPMSDLVEEITLPCGRVVCLVEEIETKLIGELAGSRPLPIG